MNWGMKFMFIKQKNMEYPVRENLKSTLMELLLVFHQVDVFNCFIIHFEFYNSPKSKLFKIEF